nr:TetR/AcrR family transcriptional regulator [Sedimentibacter sp.]
MVYINAKFESLAKEKRERIINASLNEFAKNGFEKASTNEIVKFAEISKGSLFNYFNSKKDLYLYLIEYVPSIIDTIYDEIDLSQRDFFERIKEIGIIKYRIMTRYPQAFDFLKMVEQEKYFEVQNEIINMKNKVIGEGIERIYENIDFSKFRDDIDLEKTLDIIKWTMLSFSEQQRSKINSFKDIGTEVLSEWDDYFDIMKRCFYKNEEQ